ncbi:MAG TPA: hypothetical protein VGE98_09830, partial [Thermoanaerobaculia bacterium]
MKKNVSKLKLTLESLHILDGTNAGADTLAPSCPQTCGANPGTTTTNLAAAFANSARVCCV